VEIGDGFAIASRRGSEAHDEIILKSGVITRPTNRAGGIEGGMTNGEVIIIRAAVKPIPTLANPLRSIDMRNMKPARAPALRADICAAPAASVVGEAAVAFEIARAVTERFGGDTLRRVLAAMRRTF
jgi:chorismate synthase